MKLLRTLLNFIDRQEEPRLVPRPCDGKVIFQRWHVFDCFGWSVYIHEWHNDDQKSLGVHNHPWKHSLSLVLKGRFTESRVDLSKPPGASNHAVSKLTAPAFFYVGPTTGHTVYNVQAHTWTIFLTSPRIKEWGFFKPHKMEWHYTAYDPKIHL